ncbi:fasciclin domain-containing protein [Mycolicibacterium aubagnense]|uniref:Cell surface glycolipoprotein MPB83 n=1 Tax=Mycolicibacterium aubagnense TaxID=319707 RepID=A0ABN5YN85_9MYCO|nr:fasciclin domain-containing protein [Mycolicibacterium aubagnense]TLH69520.1 fasciclin [Mycolicibacterium aubagnense]WGI35085.1 fasciclin domain-containing protein [Mycolicibacterium aubagnense]BBX82976.1 cell surface glycolipoprotein MPB83 [Mycolicibacterium aubagnense]
MQHTYHPRAAAAGMSVLAAIALTACSNDSARESTAASTTSNAASAAGAAATTEPAGAASGLVGAGCAAYAQKVPTGPGSVAGMAADPVAVAASNNPMLTTLTAALSGKLNPNVNLVETLNGGQFTVFAPTDDAFKKLSPSTLDSLKTDSAALTKILTYHVVQGQLSPDVVAGAHTTLESAAVNVTGTGADLKVDNAELVCGGVKTANATVYMIDTVLIPPK